MAGVLCAVYKCKNYGVSNCSKSYFRFPTDRDICQQWVHVCGRKDLDSVLKKLGPEHLNKNYRVCSDHFPTTSFRNPNLSSQGLIKGQIPSQNLYWQQDTPSRVSRKKRLIKGRVPSQNLYQQQDTPSHVSPKKRLIKGRVPSQNLYQQQDTLSHVSPKKRLIKGRVPSQNLYQQQDTPSHVSSKKRLIKGRVPSQNLYQQQNTPSHVSPKKSDFKIMEEPHLIKCEPGWTSGTQGLSEFGNDAQLSCANPVKIKVEPFLQCDEAGDVEEMANSIKEEIEIEDMKEEPNSDDDICGTVPNGVLEITQEANFIKCEPKWLADTEESPNFEPSCQLPCEKSVEIKVEPHETSEHPSADEDISKSIKHEILPQDVREGLNDIDFDSGTLQNEMQSLLYPAITEGSEVISYGSARECSKDSKGHYFSGAIHCKFCSKTFKENKGLQSHLRVHKDAERNLCPTCGKTFRRKVQLKEHMKLHTGDNLHYCPNCEKAFVNAKSLKRHLTAHSGERKFTCKICGKSYSHSSSLSLHRLSHSKDKIYKCVSCGIAFSSKRALERHKTKHSNARPYECASCGKGFLAKESLKRHMPKHTDQILFTCSYCNKSFSLRSTLQDHLKLNHAGNGYSNCKFCHKMFTSRTGLKSHLRMHTKLLF